MFLDANQPVKILLDLQSTGDAADPVENLINVCGRMSVADETVVFWMGEHPAGCQRRIETVPTLGLLRIQTRRKMYERHLRIGRERHRE